MMLLLDTSFRLAIVLAAALVVLPLLRRRTAALRATVLTTALACGALLPLLTVIAPKWGEPIDAEALAAPATHPLLVAIWVTGVMAHLLTLGAALVRLMGLAAAADPVRDGRLADLTVDATAECRLPAPVLLLRADRPMLPVTWGHFQPKVLLPASSATWSDERVRMVLRHELAHVRRRDWLVQLLAGIFRSVFWFHPLVWVVCRRLQLEMERACDDEVLRGGDSAASYASHLLDIARGFISEQRVPRLTAALARRSTLEHRVRAMLDVRLDHGTSGLTGRLAPAAVLLALATWLAGFGVAAPSSSTVVPREGPRLTLLLDGRIVDLSKGPPPTPDPRAGLVRGPGLLPHLKVR